MVLITFFSQITFYTHFTFLMGSVSTYFEPFLIGGV